ncbi:MAG: hypothetical protein NE327_02630 [Lentisphaeraceae bacterium]|nr:hypothetical protein [Lentisphaeraceae bacterium]
MRGNYLTFLLILSFVFGVNAQDEDDKFSFIRKADTNADFKVDASEMKYWSGEVGYYYNRGFSKSYFGEKFRTFLESFDEDRDGKFSNLEFRRFQSGSKKLFSAALDVLTLKYDENKNRRLDKEEREAARLEVGDFLNYALTVDEMKKNGVKAEAIVENDRAIDDIYD